MDRNKKGLASIILNNCVIVLNGSNILDMFESIHNYLPESEDVCLNLCFTTLRILVKFIERDNRSFMVVEGNKMSDIELGLDYIIKTYKRTVNYKKPENLLLRTFETLPEVFESNFELTEDTFKSFLFQMHYYIIKYKNTKIEAYEDTCDIYIIFEISKKCLKIPSGSFLFNVRKCLDYYNSTNL